GSDVASSRGNGAAAPLNTWNSDATSAFRLDLQLSDVRTSQLHSRGHKDAAFFFLTDLDCGHECWSLASGYGFDPDCAT
ncbi:Hypothetical predicted protein, partial [Scomber scombrus]